jgi:hypothetical protein
MLAKNRADFQSDTLTFPPIIRFPRMNKFRERNGFNSRFVFSIFVVLPTAGERARSLKEHQHDQIQYPNDSQSEADSVENRPPGRISHGRKHGPDSQNDG